MTCEDCKWFHEQKHKVGVRPCDGWCHYRPHWEPKNKGTMTCGKYKSNKAPVKHKTKKQYDESKWTDNFKAYMKAHPRYIDPDGAWREWVDLELEGHAAHIIKQVEKYAVSVKGTEARWITKNKNWLTGGGWKSHYDDAKSDSKACVDCGAPYVADSHKYIHVDGVLDKTKFRCKECRQK